MAKRGSPGAEDEKHPVQDIEIDAETAQKLADSAKLIQRAELVLERQAQAKLGPIYGQRREVLKGIPKFWTVALLNHGLIGFHASHSADQTALTYLTDVWVQRDPTEPRCFTLEFTFKENPYFTDSVLKKEAKYIPPPIAADEQADADGIKDSMLEFSWDRDVQQSATKINWKDPENALTKLYPRVAEEDDEEDITEAGSFFNFFEHEKDPYDLSAVIVNEIFPDAIDYFLGKIPGAEGDEDEDEDSEDDDDDAEEIDLEKPKSKKQKV